MRAPSLALLLLATAMGSAHIGSAHAQGATGRCFDRDGNATTEPFSISTVDRDLLLKEELKGDLCRLVANPKVHWLDWIGGGSKQARRDPVTWDFSDYPAPPPAYTQTDPDKAAALLKTFYGAQGSWNVTVSDSGRALIIHDREWRVFRVAPWAAVRQLVAVRHTRRFGYLARLYEGHLKWSDAVALDFDPKAAKAKSKAKQTAEQGTR
jgi:hypothetical protein